MISSEFMKETWPYLCGPTTIIEETSIIQAGAKALL